MYRWSRSQWIVTFAVSLVTAVGFSANPPAKGATAAKAVTPAQQAPATPAQAETAPTVPGEKVATAPSTSASDMTVTGGELSTTVVSPAAEKKPLGFFEVRPSLNVKDQNFRTEDTAELGYQFNKDLKLTYVQWFSTNLVPNGPSKSKGLDFKGEGGFARLKANNIWKSGGTSLNYESRLFTPTWADESSQGYISELRNYIKAKHEFNSWLSMDLSEVPIVYAYDKPGTAKRANPWFRNRVILNADFQISKKFLFSLPIILDFTKFRGSTAGEFANRWVYNFWMWPELDYTINDVHTIGVAYYSGNMVQKTNMAENFSDGLNTGVLQLLWNVTL